MGQTSATLKSHFFKFLLLLFFLSLKFPINTIVSALRCSFEWITGSYYLLHRPRDQIITEEIEEIETDESH